MSRKTWIIFLSVQAAGIAFALLASYALGPSPLMSGIGVGLLVCGRLLLLPGNLIEAFAAQRFLSHSGLSLHQLSLVGILVAVAINLAIWLLCAKLFRSLRG